MPRTRTLPDGSQRGHRHDALCWLTAGCNTATAAVPPPSTMRPAQGRGLARGARTAREGREFRGVERPPDGWYLWIMPAIPLLASLLDIALPGWRALGRRSWCRKQRSRMRALDPKILWLHDGEKMPGGPDR